MFSNPGQPQDTVLYQTGMVTVSTSRLVVGSTLYPIRNITAVGAHETHRHRSTPPDRTKAVLALVLCPASLVLFQYINEWALALAFVSFVAFLFLMAAGKEKRWTESLYIVTVHTAGVQQQVYGTPDRSQRDAILAALHQAVSGM